MATIPLIVRYRPLRIGFVVPHGDLESLSQVSGIASVLCGGVYNPIIPAGADSGFVTEAIKRFNIDLIVSVGRSSPECNTLLDNYKSLRKTPHMFAEHIFFEDWRTKRQNVALMDTIHTIDELWQKEIRHQPATAESKFALFAWTDEDPCNRLFAVLFGHFSGLENLRDNFSEAYQRGLKSRCVEISLDGALQQEWTELYSPLDLTRANLRQHAGSSVVEESGIYVGSSGDFDDLVNFWNLRAAGVHLKFLACDHLDRFRPFIQAYINELDAEPARYPSLARIGVHCKGNAIDRIESVMGGFSHEKHFLFHRSDASDRVIEPSQFYFGRSEVLASVDTTTFEKYKVSFSFPRKPVDAEDSNRDIGFQHLVAVVGTLSEFEYPQHTLKPPLLPKLNEAVSREITFQPSALRIDHGGVGILIELTDQSETLYPIAFRELLLRLFQLYEIHAEASPPGILTERIISAMREHRSLDACRVFKIRGVRKLLKSVRSGESVTWNQAVQIIGRESFNRFKQLYIEMRKEPDLKPADVLTFLLKKKILRPRLQTFYRVFRKRKKTRCSKCGLNELVLLKDFEGTWACPYCETEQDLALRIATEFHGQRREWRFVKSGLFRKDNNQEGALPVILTLLQLSRRLDRPLSTLIYSTALKLKVEKQCETDLAVLYYSNNRSIELGLGECKDEGGHISAQDIENLRGVLSRFEGTDIKCFLIFSKTSDNFAADELDLFRNLIEHGVGLILFTNRELEPYDPYEEADGLPCPYASSLEEMARNSAVRYLETSA